LAEVRLQEGEPLENALRRFKRKVQTEDIIKEVKRHSYYLKPGETIFSVNVDHYGVEQAFRPAVKLLKKSALAPEVFLGGYDNLETGLAFLPPPLMRGIARFRNPMDVSTRPFAKRQSEGRGRISAPPICGSAGQIIWPRFEI
jgi:ribosomal protein S21